jgi:hypothetical protein
MNYRNNTQNMFLMGFILTMGILNQPTSAHASGSLIVDSGHRHGRYTEVVVGSDRYYYDAGLYYTGGPGNYVVVDAPVGAVIYNVPANYERVEVNGERYYRYHNTYYRHNGRGYEVVRVEQAHDHGYDHGYGRGNDHGRHNDERHEHQER